LLSRKNQNQPKIQAFWTREHHHFGAYKCNLNSYSSALEMTFFFGEKTRCDFLDKRKGPSGFYKITGNFLCMPLFELKKGTNRAEEDYTKTKKN